MNIAKMSAIFAMAAILGGCCAGSYCTGKENTTYGVANDKWDVMSGDQRQSAREVFRLDQIRLAEQYKLNTLLAQKEGAVAQREMQRQDEIGAIERENSGIRDQQRKVGSVTEKERLRQKQREQDLDNLKN
ncbi:MAG TPA: hypothetical protein VLG38_08115 [Gammaproteobacteria bacterium]|nr:hypothetical protein [Gammaproteobacteria bacterium]